MRKTIKRILASLLTAIMLLTAAPLSGFVGLDIDFGWLDFGTEASALDSSGSCGTNVTYTFDSEIGLLTISGTGNMRDYASTSPSPFHNMNSIISVVINNGVTSIGSYAFSNCTGLTSITIPDSVTSIGDRAFRRCDLTSITVDSNNTVYDSRENCNAIIETETSKLIQGCKNTTIPDSVTSIGDYAFSDCTGLTSITIPDSVTSIGDEAFYNCTGLTSITIPDSVISIGGYAFEDCNGLTSITIPDSVTSIGDYAFYGCDVLTSITIPDSVTSIGVSIFYKTGYYNNIDNWEDDVLYIGNHLIEAKNEKSGSYIIKSGTRTIADSAFSDCNGLTSIAIPDSVTSIGKSPFRGCAKLESINIDVNNTVYDSRDNCNAIIETETNKLIQFCNNSILLNSVTSIGDYAFSRCAGLTSIIIPDSIKSIGDYAFWGCYKLTSVTIPDSIISIGNYVFDGCTGLTSVTIPDSVTSIGVCAFRQCYSLKNIKIPDSVISIGDYAFYECNILSSITLSDSVKSIGKFAFYRCEALTSVIIGNGVSSIANSLFYCCTGLKSVKIGNGAMSIEKKAFYGCTSLTNLTIGNSVTSIEDYAFYNCYGLEELTMPCSAKIYNSMSTFYNCENIKKITITKGSGIMQDFGTSTDISSSDTYYQYTPWFESSTNLNEVIIEDGVMNIGDNAFHTCDSLINLTIPDSVKSIGMYAFKSCNKLTSIKIGENVTSIGNSAFGGCEAVTSIIVDSNNTVYDSRENCNALIETDSNTLKLGCKNTTIPDSVTSIGDYAFNYCTGLTSITIPNSVTSIGDYEFNYCTGLTSITIPNSVTSIGSGAFCYCSGLTCITIPDSVTSIGSEVFENCNKLTSIAVDSNNTVYDSREDCNAIIETETNTLIKGCQNTIIPDGVTSIGSQAFDGCFKLTSITIPDSVTSIGNYAFYGCSGLTSITIPNSVTSIGSGAFRYCSGLTSITIPNSVTSIGTGAFANCTALSELIVYSRNCTFADKATYKKTTIYGFTGSTAETYANEKGLSFIAIDDTHTHIPDNVATVTDPTCTEQGYTTYTCSLCGDSYTADYTEPLNHPHKTWHVTKNPTATSTGLMIETCDLCGTQFSEMEIPMLIPNYVTGITVSPNRLALNVGETANLTAVITPDTAENKNVIWSSSDTDIATVADGVVTAKTPGVAMIIVQSEDGGYKDFCVVRVASLTPVNGAVVDNENGLIYGIASNSADINSYVNTVDDTMTVECDSALLGTGSIVNIVKDDVVVDSYKIVVFGDVNGDGWYDGMDAVTVSCIANGMLTKDKIGEAAYMAADCNHDGVVDEFDVAILNQAGVLLANIDQTKTQEELATDSVYAEYLNLIDQTAGTDTEEEPEQTQEPQKTYESIFEMIIDLIKSVFEMLISFLLK